MYRTTYRPRLSYLHKTKTRARPLTLTVEEAIGAPDYRGCSQCNYGASLHICAVSG